MKLGRTNPFRIGLFTVLTHINTKVFSLFRHSERKAKTSQDCCDQQRPKGRQPIGHKHNLKLISNQAKPALLNKNLRCGVSGDQLSASEDTGQDRADCATDTVDCKGVEGIIKTQRNLELHRPITKQTSDRTDRHPSSWRHKTSCRGDAHQSSHCSGRHTHDRWLAISPGFDQ